jgi:hypothetical protein
MERTRLRDLTRSRHALVILVASVLVATSLATDVNAASWNGIEPFKTRREEVLKILGNPVSESAEGALRFGVSGGTVLVSFVSEKFVATKRLRPELAGTVLEIVLQHDHSSNTPESMGLPQNKEFIRDDSQNALVFHSNSSGIVYTFLDGTLKTTRFTFSASQLARARR